MTQARLMQGSPDAPALHCASGTVTYAELAALVTERLDQLGPHRRLVMLEMGNDLDSVVSYLAALEGRHPVVLLESGDLSRHRDLVARYDPDVVGTTGGGLRQVRHGTNHELHPDLAVLLTTSGSTGSPKLVRLSHRNLLANADSIADYLRLGARDRAITSLPLHYCYGLSVLNSHLRSGAAVTLTDLSVLDDCFWDLVRDTGTTGLAGVPYTFDLLDGSGFADRSLPSLRYLTQAGGRMPPEQVRRHARLGRERGWDLFVMYGQTEATARMAYLPPHLVEHRPETIGVPVPGGSLRLDPVPGVDDPDVGELVYTGPNVMMGYATTPRDFARGACVDELRTGDLGRLTDDGLWEVIGRRSRLAKLFGLRIDLDRVEQGLTAAGWDTRVVQQADQLHVYCLHLRAADAVRSRTAELAAVPAGFIGVHRVDAFPTTSSGKTDYSALSTQSELLSTQRQAGGQVTEGIATPQSVRDVLALCLGRADAGTQDSFVSLGGDSLSFVETSLRLSEHLGTLPHDWQRLPAGALADRGRPPRRHCRLVATDTAVVLRAVAILMVVLTHADVILVPGGAHVLLAVAGFNLSRFVLAGSVGLSRVRRILVSLAGFAIPAAAWIGGVALVTGQYRWPTALFLNQLLGERRWTDDWQFWFLDVLVVAFASVAAALSVSTVARVHDRHPFGSAVAVVAATLALRYWLVGVHAGPTERYWTPGVLWCLALGWAAASARGRRQRLLVAAVAVFAVHGFFGDLQREALVALGIVVLAAVRDVPLPGGLIAVVRVLAGASLWIYLTHWQVYRPLEDAGHQNTAVVASLLVGILSAHVYASALAMLKERAQQYGDVRAYLCQTRTQSTCIRDGSAELSMRGSS